MATISIPVYLTDKETQKYLDKKGTIHKEVRELVKEQVKA